MFSARRVTSLLVLQAVALALSASVVEAGGVCGDDVSGRRVACDCGDIVVSDTTLQAGDPVVSHRCPLDGLIVRASRLADSVTLSLGGHSLVGSSYGYGVRVDSGGNDGALIVGGDADAFGEIVGFATGIAAGRSAAVRRIERVRVKGNRHHGVELRTTGTLLIDVSASQNGGDGIRMLGNGGRLIGVRAERNAGNGIRVRSNGTSIDATATGNGRHGIVSDGGGNDLGKVVARDNGRQGAVVRGRTQSTAGLRSESNGRGALRGTGAGGGR